MSILLYIPTDRFDHTLDLEPVLQMIQHQTRGDLYRCEHAHTVTTPNLQNVKCEKQEGCEPRMVAAVRASVPIEPVQPTQETKR